MKYTDEIILEVADNLRKGFGRIAATKSAGINYQTFLDWMAGRIPTQKQQGRGFSKPSQLVFSEVVKEAEAEGRVAQRERAIAAVMAGMNKFWQAGAWWLERNYPDEYRNRSEITGANGKDITPATPIDLSKLSNKELDKLIELQSKCGIRS